MTRWARKDNGLRIPHHPPAWMGLLPAVTQIRPDNAIETGEVKKHEGHWDLRGWAHHIARHPDHGNRHDLTDAEVDKLTDEELREMRDGGAVRGDRDHIHREKAKYLHAPAPYVTEIHDHDIAFAGKPKMRAGHVDYYHDGADVEGPHEYRYKDKSVQYATRLDFSPTITEEDCLRAERFYFVIEGTFKNLSVLTWVRAHDENAVVISVPAVGQWKAPELEEIADRYLAWKECFIIADSDAHRNSQVMKQAKRIRRHLLNKDVDAHILLPPERVLGKDEDGNWKKVGADDAVGIADKSLHDFILVHVQVDVWEVLTTLIPETWARRQIWTPKTGSVSVRNNTLPNRTSPGRRRNLSVLWALSEQSDAESGLYWGSVSGLARDIGMSEDRALKAVHELVEYGWITLEGGSLETEESEFSFGRVWRDRPTLRMHERLRSKVTYEQFGEFLERRKEEDGRRNGREVAGAERISGVVRDSAAPTDSLSS
jgi:hypothetical protein